MREEGGREGGKRKEGGRAKKYKRTMKIEKQKLGCTVKGAVTSHETGRISNQIIVEI